MTFYSPGFIFIFLPCIVALYALAGKKLRNAVLFLGSVVFYLLASHDLMSMAILASSLIFNYAAGLFIGIAEGKMRKLLFGFCTFVNASALLSPKIISIITESFSESLPEGLAIVAPVGFSFYMFKNMSYLRQVYGRKIRSEQSFFALGAYLVNFAQVLSGPIQTYADWKNLSSVLRLKFFLPTE